jgi:hypothetical protein
VKDPELLDWKGTIPLGGVGELPVSVTVTVQVVELLTSTLDGEHPTTVVVGLTAWGVTWTVTVTALEYGALVPLIVIVKVPGVVDVILRTVVCQDPDTRLTGLTLNDAIGPSGLEVAESETLPEKPLPLGGRLVTFRFDVAKEPATKVRLVELADMLNLVMWIEIVGEFEEMLGEDPMMVRQ